LFIGIFLLSIYFGNQVYTEVYAQTSVQRFWMTRGSPPSHAEPAPLPLNDSPDFHLWSEKRIKAYQASLLANVPPPLGILEISKLHLEVPVLEGTDDLTLDRAVGHILGTASLGEPGNIGIAGHRDGFFRGLKDLQVGEAIDLYDQRRKSHYVVDDIQIVSPDDVSVLAPGTKSSLTLVTCCPFYFVGSAPLRYIVHATSADSEPFKETIFGSRPQTGLFTTFPTYPTPPKSTWGASSLASTISSRA
jgi:sortase A